MEFCILGIYLVCTCDQSSSKSNEMYSIVVIVYTHFHLLGHFELNLSELCACT